MSTLKDIAKRAEVSVCTVSRYINHKIKVKDDTARKIEAAIEELNYIPNSAAKTLKTNSSKNVALLIPTLNNLVFAESAHEIEAVFRRNGYSVFIYGFENNIEREILIIPRLVENRVAGVILNTLPSNYENLNHLRILEKNGIPYVFLNRMFSPVPVPSVYADYNRGAIDGVQHLAGKGRRRIALFIGRKRQPQSHANYLGYRTGLELSGLSRGDMVYECDYDHSRIPSLVKDALNKGVDGCYCMTDLIAIYVMKSIKEAGLRVPDDVSVIGAGNTALSTIVEPQLTSIDLQNQLLGTLGAELLLNIMRKHEYRQTTVLSTTLIERDST